MVQAVTPSRATGLAALVVLAAVATTASAMTGEEWRGLPPPARLAYVTAIVDAWNSFAIVKESLGSADPGITVFTDLAMCLRDRGLGTPQVLGLVERYTEQQPGLRGKEMPDIVFAAVSEACRR